MKKWQFDRLGLYVACAYLGAYLAGGCSVLPPAEGPPTPVECGSHVWGDDDGDGVGYRLPTTSVRVMNASGYLLDLGALGGDVMRFSPDVGEFTVPMERVNEPGNGWLGLAQVWVDNRTGVIRRALVSMNEGYSQVMEPVVATHVGCMEVLHTAALGHQGGAGSCMNDCSGASDWGACMRDPAKQTPDAHDFEQLAAIYATDVEPPTVCVQGGLTLLTFRFPAPGESVGDHAH